MENLNNDASETPAAQLINRLRTLSATEVEIMPVPESIDIIAVLEEYAAKENKPFPQLEVFKIEKPENSGKFSFLATWRWDPLRCEVISESKRDAKRKGALHMLHAYIHHGHMLMPFLTVTRFNRFPVRIFRIKKKHQARSEKHHSFCTSLCC